MQREVMIRVEPGGDAILLYSDDSILQGMPGVREMTRASNVVWSKQRQRWIIELPDGEILGDPLGYVSRMMAIAEEVQILNQMLGEGYTGYELGFREANHDYS